MIRPMTKADIPACMALKEAAGWNQTPADWECVIDLQPDGCWVDERNEVVAGSTTVVCYGDELAWVGMVLTLPSFRRQGVARGLMEHALEYCGHRGVRVVKLDATDMGRPLYAKLGFVDEQPIERWKGAADHSGAFKGFDLETALVLDRRAFGIGQDVARLASASTEQFGDARGYVLARPGSNAHFIGPCIAETPDQAERLIRSVLAQRPGAEFFWDLLPENRQVTDLANSLGFEPARGLVRMARPGGTSNLGDQSLVWATAGFEYC